MDSSKKWHFAHLDCGASPVALVVKNLSAKGGNQDTPVQSLGWEDALV